MRSPVGDEQRGNDMSCRRPQHVGVWDPAKVGWQSAFKRGATFWPLNWLDREPHPINSGNPGTLFTQQGRLLKSREIGQSQKPMGVHSPLFHRPKKS